MNDQNPDSGAPGAGAPSPAPDPKPASKPADEAAVRYAVYDTRYLRFLPGVHDKKPSKADAKKIVGHDDFEIREV